MKTSFSPTKIISLLGLVGVLAMGAGAAGCSSTATHESTGEYVDDSVITTKVKSALLGDDVVKSFSVNVETMQGVVQLSGFVNTAAQKEAAGNDAAAVKGVRNVHNNLIVK